VPSRDDLIEDGTGPGHGDRHVDVAVVGGGPAGSAAAITLARGGAQVLLVDKASFPRDKCCGDGLTTGALRHLEHLGLDPRSVPSWKRVDDIVVQGPRGRNVRFPLPRGRGTFAAVARRVELDAALVDLARSRGVEVYGGRALRAATARPTAVHLDIEGLGVVRAGHVVGADGMWSPLRKALGVGLDDYRGDWHAFRQYFRNVSPRASTELVVWFEPDLLPGYAWSFPLADGRANVGFGILRGSKLDGAAMGKTWTDLLRRPHIVEFLGRDAEPEGPRKAWPIPTRLPGPALHAGRALFVGDAAALGDPMTGEGIGQALASGIAAAQAILAGTSTDPATTAGERYERWVRRELLPDTRMANWLTHALRHRKGARAAIAVAGLTPWTRRNFARWLFEDEPRGVILTPRRLHPRFLRRPGTFRISE
jgi:geranylgeranyl reductase family protein